MSLMHANQEILLISPLEKPGDDPKIYGSSAERIVNKPTNDSDASAVIKRTFKISSFQIPSSWDRGGINE